LQVASYVEQRPDGGVNERGDLFVLVEANLDE
jgi:hypothetical protein